MGMLGAASPASRLRAVAMSRGSVSRTRYSSSLATRKVTITELPSIGSLAAGDPGAEGDGSWVGFAVSVGRGDEVVLDVGAAEPATEHAARNAASRSVPSRALRGGRGIGFSSTGFA